MKTAVLMLAVLTFSAPIAAHAGGVVTESKGETFIVRNGKYLPAHVGMKVKKDDVVKTGPASQMDFSVNDQGGVRLLGPTELGVASTKKQDTQVDLRVGNIIVNLKEKLKGAKFQVQTPAAVLAVRGTQFWGREEQKSDKNVTTFAVRRGTVEVTDKATGESFTMEKGEAIDLSIEAGAAHSRKALAAEMGAMAQADEIRTSGAPAF